MVSYNLALADLQNQINARTNPTTADNNKIRLAIYDASGICPDPGGQQELNEIWMMCKSAKRDPVRFEAAVTRLRTFLRGQNGGVVTRGDAVSPRMAPSTIATIAAPVPQSRIGGHGGSLSVSPAARPESFRSQSPAIGAFSGRGDYAGPPVSPTYEQTASHNARLSKFDEMTPAQLTAYARQNELSQRSLSDGYTTRSRTSTPGPNAVTSISPPCYDAGPAPMHSPQYPTNIPSSDLRYSPHNQLVDSPPEILDSLPQVSISARSILPQQSPVSTPLPLPYGNNHQRSVSMGMGGGSSSPSPRGESAYPPASSQRPAAYQAHRSGPSYSAYDNTPTVQQQLTGPQSAPPQAYPTMNLPTNNPVRLPSGNAIANNTLISLLAKRSNIPANAENDQLRGALWDVVTGFPDPQGKVALSKLWSQCNSARRNPAQFEVVVGQLRGVLKIYGFPVGVGNDNTMGVIPVVGGFPGPNDQYASPQNQVQGQGNAGRPQAHHANTAPASTTSSTSAPKPPVLLPPSKKSARLSSFVQGIQSGLHKADKALTAFNQAQKLHPNAAPKPPAKPPAGHIPVGHGLNQAGGVQPLQGQALQQAIAQAQAQVLQAQLQAQLQQAQNQAHQTPGGGVHPGSLNQGHPGFSTGSPMTSPPMHHQPLSAQPTGSTQNPAAYSPTSHPSPPLHTGAPLSHNPAAPSGYQPLAYQQHPNAVHPNQAQAQNPTQMNSAPPMTNQGVAAPGPQGQSINGQQQGHGSSEPQSPGPHHQNADSYQSTQYQPSLPGGAPGSPPHVQAQAQPAYQPTQPQQAALPPSHQQQFAPSTQQPGSPPHNPAEPPYAPTAYQQNQQQQPPSPQAQAQGQPAAAGYQPTQFQPGAPQQQPPQQQGQQDQGQYQPTSYQPGSPPQNPAYTPSQYQQNQPLPPPPQGSGHPSAYQPTQYQQVPSSPPQQPQQQQAQYQPTSYNPASSPQNPGQTASYVPTQYQQGPPPAQQQQPPQQQAQYQPASAPPPQNPGQAPYQPIQYQQPPPPSAQQQQQASYQPMSYQPVPPPQPAFSPASLQQNAQPAQGPSLLQNLQKLHQVYGQLTGGDNAQAQAQQNQQAQLNAQIQAMQQAQNQQTQDQLAQLQALQNQQMGTGSGYQDIFTQLQALQNQQSQGTGGLDYMSQYNAIMQQQQQDSQQSLSQLNQLLAQQQQSQDQQLSQILGGGDSSGQDALAQLQALQDMQAQQSQDALSQLQSLTGGTDQSQSMMDQMTSMFGGTSIDPSSFDFSSSVDLSSMDVTGSLSIAGGLLGGDNTDTTTAVLSLFSS